MIIRKITPTLQLQPFIKYYLYLNDFKLVGKFKMISIPDIEMYFVFRPTKVIVRNSVFEHPKVFIGGIQDLNHDDFSHMYDSEVKKGFVIVFKPMAIYQLFGIKLKDLANFLAYGDEIISKDINQLWEELIAIEDPIKMISKVERYLLSYSNRAEGKKDLVNHAFRLMEVKNGCMRQNEICKDLGITPRKLQRCFKEEIGFSPKEILQIYRFNHVINNINQISYSNLTQLSYLCDYYDQSHFIHDFKRVTGQTPRIFVSNHEKCGIHNVDNRSFFDF